MIDTRGSPNERQCGSGSHVHARILEARMHTRQRSRLKVSKGGRCGSLLSGADVGLRWVALWLWSQEWLSYVSIGDSWCAVD